MDNNFNRNDQIRKIMASNKLSQTEKQRYINAIRNGEQIDEKTIDVDIAKIKKRIDNDNKSCHHYNNKKCSRFHFSCCDVIDPCRRCHLERLEIEPCHNVKVVEITCNECDTKQQCGESCVKCNVKFNKNYCSECFLWTDVDVIHCDKCKLCRVGKNLFHCDTCNACFQKDAQHKCANIDISNLNCAVCHVDITTSQSQSIVLQCNHAIHQTCLNGILNNNQYRCPLCRKSFLVLSEYWKKIKNQISNQPMPKLYVIKPGITLNSPYGKFKVTSQSTENRKLYNGYLLNMPNKTGSYAMATLNEECLENEFDTNITCNDCEKKCTTKFHFLGLECLFCNGFNTNID